MYLISILTYYQAYCYELFWEGCEALYYKYLEVNFHGKMPCLRDVNRVNRPKITMFKLDKRDLENDIWVSIKSSSHQLQQVVHMSIICRPMRNPHECRETYIFRTHFEEFCMSCRKLFCAETPAQCTLTSPLPGLAELKDFCIFHFRESHAYSPAVQPQTMHVLNCFIQSNFGCCTQATTISMTSSTCDS